MEDKEFITVTEDGVTKEVELIHYFTLDKNNKDYVLFSDGNVDDSNNILIRSAELVEENDEVKLKGIKDQEVIDEITKIIKELMNN